MITILLTIHFHPDTHARSKIGVIWTIAVTKLNRSPTRNIIKHTILLL